MSDVGISGPEGISARLREQAARGAIRFTFHAQGEMDEEDVTPRDVREVLLDARVIENYPGHERGPCCLVCGQDRARRYLHVVCTSALDVVIIITVYEPRAPKWVTPFERGKRP